MSLFFMLPTGGLEAGTVTLSGETITTTDVALGNLVCGVEIRLDGRIYRLNGDTGAGGPTFTAIDTGTDWIIPNSAATNKTYHVRMSKFSGNALDGGSAAEDTWIELDDTKSWWFETGTFDWDYQGDLLISDDGGSTTLASATYVFDLNNL